MSVATAADAIVLRAWLLEAPRVAWQRYTYEVRGAWARLSPTEQQALLAYVALIVSAVFEQLLAIIGKVLTR